jgi:hypothetical protein
MTDIRRTENIFHDPLRHVSTHRDPRDTIFGTWETSSVTELVLHRLPEADHSDETLEGDLAQWTMEVGESRKEKESFINDWLADVVEDPPVVGTVVSN